MNKWQRLAEIRKDRINELEKDRERLLGKRQKLRTLIDRWKGIANDWKEMYHKHKA